MVSIVGILKKSFLKPSRRQLVQKLILKEKELLNKNNTIFNLKSTIYDLENENYQLAEKIKRLENELAESKRQIEYHNTIEYSIKNLILNYFQRDLKEYMFENECIEKNQITFYFTHKGDRGFNNIEITFDKLTKKVKFIKKTVVDENDCWKMKVVKNNNIDMATILDQFTNREDDN